jgi:hypothetical protein
MRMRLTRQQREFQEQTLRTLGLQEEFQPSVALVAMLGSNLLFARKELELYKTQSIFSIIKERILK